MPDDFTYSVPNADYLDLIQQQLWPSVKRTANQFADTSPDQQGIADLQGGLGAPSPAPSTPPPYIGGLGGQPPQQQDQGILSSLGNAISGFRTSPFMQGLSGTVQNAGNAFFSPGGQALLGYMAMSGMTPKSYGRGGAFAQGLRGAMDYGMRAEQQQAQQQEAQARTQLAQQQLGMQQQKQVLAQRQQDIWEQELAKLSPQERSAVVLGIQNKDPVAQQLTQLYPNDPAKWLAEWKAIKEKPTAVNKYDLAMRAAQGDPVAQEALKQLQSATGDKSQTEEQLTKRALAGDTEAQAILDRMQQRRLEIAKIQAGVTTRERVGEAQRLKTEQAIGEGKYYRYNPATKTMEQAPADMSPEEAQATGFRPLTPKQVEKTSAMEGVQAAFQELKMAADQMKNQSGIGLAMGNIPGGQQVGQMLGMTSPEVGALYESTRARFSGLFDKLIGGTRAAASLPYQKFTGGRLLPNMTDTPNVIDTKLKSLEIVTNALIDENYRAVTGAPPDPAINKQLTELGQQLDRISSGGTVQKTQPQASQPQRGGPPSGYMTIRNKSTGETVYYPVGETPSGWMRVQNQ